MSTLSVGTIKSASSAAPVFQNSSGTQVGTLCRAWVSFDGFTQSKRDDFNVSTITDVATGRYRINFTNALPNANYCAVAMVGNFESTTTANTSVNTDGTRSTTQFAIRVVSGDANTADKRDINLAFFAE
tara:strand:+ start:58 stop:444 length:387 start_codon:yes stop_codon:yes gene_type:complete